MTKQFDDFMDKRKQVNRKPPINIRRVPHDFNGHWKNCDKLTMMDEGMHFLELCEMELIDDELRDCESRFLGTFH